MYHMLRLPNAVLSLRACARRFEELVALDTDETIWASPDEAIARALPALSNMIIQDVESGILADACDDGDVSQVRMRLSWR